MDGKNGWTENLLVEGGRNGRIMRGNIVRSEEWVVMRYSSVLDLHTHTVASGHAYCSSEGDGEGCF